MTRAARVNALWLSLGSEAGRPTFGAWPDGQPTGKELSRAREPTTPVHPRTSLNRREGARVVPIPREEASRGKNGPSRSRATRRIEPHCRALDTPFYPGKRDRVKSPCP